MDSGDTETGVTIHHVTNDYDTGDVIAQCVVSIIPGDAVITIEERVKEVEKSLICGVIQNWNYSETE